MIKAEIATAEDIENLTAVGKPLQFPDENDFEKINNSFNGLQTTLSIPSQLLTEALNATIEHSCAFWDYDLSTDRYDMYIVHS